MIVLGVVVWWSMLCTVQRMDNTAGVGEKLV